MAAALPRTWRRARSRPGPPGGDAMSGPASAPTRRARVGSAEKARPPTTTGSPAAWATRIARITPSSCGAATHDNATASITPSSRACASRVASNETPTNRACQPTARSRWTAIRAGVACQSPTPVETLSAGPPGPVSTDGSRWSSASSTAADTRCSSALSTAAASHWSPMWIGAGASRCSMTPIGPTRSTVSRTTRRASAASPAVAASTNRWTATGSEAIIPVTVLPGDQTVGPAGSGSR